MAIENSAFGQGIGSIFSRAAAPVLLLLAMAAGITWVAPRAWLVLLIDGTYVLVLLAAAFGLGAWPARWLAGGGRTIGQQACLSTGLGLGLLSLLVLVTGAAGALTSPLAWVLVGAGVVLGIVRVYTDHSETRKRAANRNSIAEWDSTATSGMAAGPNIRRQTFAQTVALLPLALLLTIAAVGASLPPGVLWIEEARGYDALEYHLQCPREYFEAGRIQFLPHNVYASFPQQQEMLYFLLMQLAGNPQDAAIPSQLLHLACGILTVAALAAWAAPGWPRVTVALALGTTPWLAYLGCLAYVELPMLFFAALAGCLIAENSGVVRDTEEEQPPPRRSPHRRQLFIAGVLAGLAAGCKYTAAAMVAGALFLAILGVYRGGVAERLRSAAVFGFAALLAFSPWLIRNAAFTGNPVYPFAYEWFGGRAWSQDQAQQWLRGHALGPAEGSRLRTAVQELFGEMRPARTIEGPLPRAPGGKFILSELAWRPSLFGVAIFVAGIAGIAVNPGHQVVKLGLVWLAAMLAAWLGFTHMPGRFVVPIVVPLGVLLARALAARPAVGDSRRHAVNGKTRDDAAGATAPHQAGVMRSPGRWIVGLAVLLVVLGTAQAVQLAGLFSGQLSGDLRPDDVVGATQGWAALHTVNRFTPPDALVWIVGDAAVFHVQRRMHYTVVFNRDPWVELAEQGAGPPECVRWLRERDVTHVAFCWPEIERLRRTYGFSPVVTREWAAALAGAGLRLSGSEAGYEVYQCP